VLNVAIIGAGGCPSALHLPPTAWSRTHPLAVLGRVCGYSLASLSASVEGMYRATAHEFSEISRATQGALVRVFGLYGIPPDLKGQQLVLGDALGN